MAPGAVRHELEELIGDVDALLWILDPESGRVGYVSERAAELLGHAPAAWTATPSCWPGLVHADDRVALLGACSQVAADQSDRHVDHRAHAADGTLRRFRTHLHARVPYVGGALQLV